MRERVYGLEDELDKRQTELATELAVPLMGVARSKGCTWPNATQKTVPSLTMPFRKRRPPHAVDDGLHSARRGCQLRGELRGCG